MFNKQVLMQVLKDGRTYPTLAKEMAAFCLSQVPVVGLPDVFTIAIEGTVRDGAIEGYSADKAKAAAELRLPVYAFDYHYDGQLNLYTFNRWPQS